MKFTERQTEILGLLRARPAGLRFADLIDRFARHPDVLKADLHALRDANLIGASANGGSKVRWAAIEHLPAVTAAHQAVMTPPATDAQRKALERHRAMKRAAEKAEEGPTQSVRPAGTWTTETKTAASWIPL